jgi:hypothetical protein
MTQFLLDPNNDYGYGDRGVLSQLLGAGSYGNTFVGGMPSGVDLGSIIDASTDPTAVVSGGGGGTDWAGGILNLLTAVAPGLINTLVPKPTGALTTIQDAISKVLGTPGGAAAAGAGAGALATMLSSNGTCNTRGKAEAKRLARFQALTGAGIPPTIAAREAGFNRPKHHGISYAQLRGFNRVSGMLSHWGMVPRKLHGAHAKRKR